jgi:RNA polymerase sigma factor (sigma-70 family)
VVEVQDDDFDAAFPALFTIAYRVAYRSVGSAAEAEEIAQETLTRALLRWGRVADYAPAWVATVSLRLAIDTTRRHIRQSSSQVTDLPGTDADAERRLDLHNALRRLPKRQREVLACRYLADLPDAETAQLLKISPGAVKQHAARGLIALRGMELATEGPSHA